MSSKYIVPASYDSGMFKLEQEVTLFRLTPNHKYTFALVNTNVDDVTAHRIEQVLEDSPEGIADDATLLYDKCDESATQIFQAQVPPSGVVKIKLTGYAGNDKVTFGFDRIGEVSASGLSTETLLEVVEELTQEEKQLFLPETIEVDYIQTANQSGFTIPEGAFSQKDGVPYFGNNPIVPGAGQTHRFATGVNQANWLTKQLGTFNIPAGLIGNSAKYLCVEFDLILKYETIIPTYTTFDMTLCLLTGQEFAAINTERVGIFFMDAGSEAGKNLQSIRGSMILQYNHEGNQVQNAMPVANLFGTFFQSSAYPGVPRVIEVDTDVILNSGLGFSNASGEADTLTLMLVPQASFTSFTILVQGSCTVYPDFNPNA